MKLPNKAQCAICVIIGLLGCFACKDNSQKDAQIEALSRERDSIASVVEDITNDHKELIGYIQGIEKAIDSISYEENILIIGRDEGGKPFDK